MRVRGQDFRDLEVLATLRNGRLHVDPLAMTSGIGQLNARFDVTAKGQGGDGAALSDGKESAICDDTVWFGRREFRIVFSASGFARLRCQLAGIGCDPERTSASGGQWRTNSQFTPHWHIERLHEATSGQP